MIPAIRVRNLFKTYPAKPPVEAVRGIDLEIQTGECYGVLGPNGAGKTTTIEILEGLLPATSGTAEIFGLRWGEDDARIRQRIGVSLQETRLSERLTVKETLRMFRSFYSAGLSVEEAMDQVSLGEKGNTWVKNLSGGQKQRLAVATALIGKPDLIFLDEPTTGLDPTSRRQIWEIIETLIQSGKTILLTTHYMEEAERLCDRVAIFDQGRVIAEGTPAALIHSLGAENLIEFRFENLQPGDQLNLRESLREFPQLECLEGGFRISASQPHLILPRLMQFLQEQQLTLSSLTTRHASLEDVFVKLTGRHLVDPTHSDNDQEQRKQK
jgi:ABC-2 type transport system ATP-binding protein